MNRTVLKSSLFALVFAGLATLGTAASAEVISFKADLTGAEEVPAVETAATGTATVSYDTATKMLTWTLEYEGLSGDASAAHFHGSAAVGENAPPIVTIEDLASGAQGEEELNELQATMLRDGLLYINVHTAANPDGEIRGQVVRAEG